MCLSKKVAIFYHCNFVYTVAHSRTLVRKMVTGNTNLMCRWQLYVSTMVDIMFCGVQAIDPFAYCVGCMKNK